MPAGRNNIASALLCKRDGVLLMLVKPDENSFTSRFLDLKNLRSHWLQHTVLGKLLNALAGFVVGVDLH